MSRGMKRSTIWEHLCPQADLDVPSRSSHPYTRTISDVLQTCSCNTRSCPRQSEEVFGGGATATASVPSDSLAVCVGSVCISGRPSLPHHLAVCANCHLELGSCLCMSHASFPALFTISPPCFSGATLGLQNRVPRPALDWGSVEGFHIFPDISRGYDKHVNADSFQSCWDCCLACALSLP